MKPTKILGILFLLIVQNSWSQQLAFPTAEGYGKYTKGGRGGKVYEVTNLKTSGEGSLGAAISASGPRIVVFRVAGTIEGDFKINNDYITIAGQTAPGDGICIKGSLTISANEVIVRYIRVRANPVSETDAIGGRYNKKIIFDHISASWSSDEVMSLYHNEYVTIQWCMITEACAKGNTGHRFGGIWGNLYGSYHHNLIAHNDSRNPRWASGCGYNDYRNNVLYNWGYNSCYGAEGHQVGNDKFNFSTINMVANYYKPGPGTNSGVSTRIAEPSTRDGEADAGKWWLEGNFVEGSTEVSEDNWKGFASSQPYFRLEEPWEAMPVFQQSPQEAYEQVLLQSGCSKPNRDSIDMRIINEVRNGTATYGNNGIITVPGDVGGWPALVNGIAPEDSDHDGMPDYWEKSHGLDTANADDRNTTGADGYTMLEVYLNSLTTYDTILVTGLMINSEADTLSIHETRQLIASVVPHNATNKAIIWSSSDTTVVTVNQSGLIEAKAIGSATITVTTEDGGFVSSVIVIVISPLSIEGIDGENTMKIYPNPCKDHLNIQFKKELKEQIDIKLFNTSGKMVYHKKVYTINQQLELHDLESGNYILKLEGDTFKAVNQVIKL